MDEWVLFAGIVAAVWTALLLLFLFS